MNFICAKPIWLEGKQSEVNIQALFEAEFSKHSEEKIFLKITGATLFRIYINDNFVHYGPARAAHKYARIDELEITEYCKNGDNKINIEVAGYNCNSFYTIKQLSYLCAEIINNENKIKAFTGRDFTGKIINERIQKVMRYSFQRTFTEVWNYNNNEPLGKENNIQTLNLDITYLKRGVRLPDYTIYPCENIYCRGLMLKEPKDLKKGRFIVNNQRSFIHFRESQITHKPYYDFQNVRQNIQKICDEPFDNISIQEGEYILLDLKQNRTGFILSKFLVNEDSRILIAFDEILDNNTINFNKWNSINIVEYNLKTSNKEYLLESFEAYCFRYALIWVVSGNVELNYFGIRSYMYQIDKYPKIVTDNQNLQAIYKAAVETFRQNTVDIFMDCPSRERAGWLFDSYYSAMAEYCFTGKSDVERAFLNNYLLYDNNTDIPNGMIPMCYPADTLDGEFIPQWNLWFIIELEKYFKRDRKSDKEKFRKICYNIIHYLDGFRNGEGLLERLPSFNYVDWSEANKWLKDVNYPTNMLYSKALKIVGNLYNDNTLINEAKKLRDITINKSFNGKYFTDNAIRNKNHELVNTGNMSEACQYYAIRFGEINLDDTKYQTLKNTVLNIFGPKRKKLGLLPDIVSTDLLMGIYLRIEILLQLKEYELLLSEIEEYFGEMVKFTGTIWEHNDPKHSLNHGYTSYVGVAIKEALEALNIK